MPADTSAYQREWASKNKDRARAYSRKHRLKKRYGLTPKEALAMWVASAGLCRCCGKQTMRPDIATSRENMYRATNIDHCHETGKIRGVLCVSCNSGIGSLGDTTKGVKQALEYLNEWG